MKDALRSIDTEIRIWLVVTPAFTGHWKILSCKKCIHSSMQKNWLTFAIMNELGDLFECRPRVTWDQDQCIFVTAIIHPIRYEGNSLKTLFLFRRFCNHWWGYKCGSWHTRIPSKRIVRMTQNIQWKIIHSHTKRKEEIFHRVILTFNEPLDAHGSTVKLFHPVG